jgi:hypothetical protein
MLEKLDSKAVKQSNIEGDKSFWNIKMLSHYNFAIELEHLKNFEKSKIQYELAKEIAEKNSKKNQALIKSI